MAVEYYGRKALRANDDILFCAGDVETDGLGGRLLSVQWGFMGEIKYACDEDMLDKFFDDFFEYPKPAVWFFHVAQYDWRYIISAIEERGYLVEVSLRTETDIYEVRARRTEGEKWSIMRDSFALWSHKLEDLAKTFCPEKPKLEIDIENFDPHNPEHIEYAKRDVEILLDALPKLFGLVNEHFGVNPSATAAGTALKAWQKTLPKDKIYDCSQWGEREQFIREGYYGGLVFLTTNVPHENCETYDRNSSYPAVMLEHGVPCGRPQYTTDFEEGYPGIYRVRVKTPDNLIVPILPARNIRGAMRWYKGEFETHVTTQELQFAAKHGYVIQEVFEGVFFETIEFPFEELINKCRFLRKNFKDQPLEQVAKLIQNSLYGKFGSRRERTRLLHHSGIEEFDGLMPFDEAGIWYIQKELDEKMRCLPQWAAFITANARLALLEEVYAIGPENALYGDTDSITIKSGFSSHINIGREYGQWKLEKEWDIFRPIAPKVYSGILKNGEYKGAAKGLPKKGITDKQWKELLEDGETSAHTLSLSSLKISLKQGVKPARQLLRKSSTLNHSTNFEIVENGLVRVKCANG